MNDDYFDEDVTNATAEELGTLVKLRIRRYPSAQVFKDGKKTILRTWKIEFEVEDAAGGEV
jgi:hypothetical protein